MRAGGIPSAYMAGELAEDAVARRSGTMGVPCFAVDSAFAVSGARPASALMTAFDHALDSRGRMVGDA